MEQKVGLRDLLPYLRPHRRSLALVGALTALGSVLALASPLLTREVLDAVRESQPTGRTVALLLLVRPPLKDALDRGGTAARTDPRALSGSSAVVVERVSEDGGQVRLNGELWRARPYAGGAPLEVGHVVSVAAVEGATVLVYSSDLS